MFIALGVPILILPSLVDLADTLWAFGIVMWTICVLQGFLQNTAYGEMVTTFPRAAGLPGCAQVVFTPVEKTKKYDMGKLIGAFCAWCYWFAWTPVVAIFTTLIGDYVMFYFDMDPGQTLLVYTALGLVIVTVMTLISARGLTGGSLFGLVLAIVAIVPLVVILTGAYFAGGDGGGAMFDLGRIGESWYPAGWEWNGFDIAMLFGAFALAQWSGCAWETAALYGPEYKDPGKDVPKALFACGLICLLLYFFVAFSVFGALPIDDIFYGEPGVSGNQYHTLYPIAMAVFGDIGGTIAIIMLISAMLLIIQTGFLGSSRTLYYMSEEGNLPKYLSRKNKRGMPVMAMLTVSVVNMILIVTATAEIPDPLGEPGAVMVGGPVMILAASAVSYCLAHVIALSAYFKSKTDIRFKDLARPFSAPKGWKYVALFMVFYEACVLIPCLIYWMYLAYGLMTMIVGIVILGGFFPIWFWTQSKLMKDGGADAQPAEE